MRFGELDDCAVFSSGGGAMRISRGVLVDREWSMDLYGIV